jgi:arylsulfatase A-like enzyme
MPMFYRLIAGAAAAAGLSGCTTIPDVQSSASSASEHPNIVLIMTDDLGYADIGVYGARDVRTPNLDRLARQGARFVNFYANAPVCSPTRAALMTGRYQQRAGIETPLSAAGGPRSDIGLAVLGDSLPQRLSDLGYRTGLVGKWHLGTNAEFSPIAHGFDTFFGFKSGFVDYYRHTDGSGNPDLFENEVPVEADGYMTDLITERSVRFIADNAGDPFFLSVQYNAPHWPYQVPDEPSVAVDNARHLRPTEENTSTRAEYVAMVERMDAGVGAILEALEERGLASDTLVIFTNDNGGEWLSNSGPVFHRKWTLWEGGLRVPAIVRWPGRIPARQVVDQVGVTMDLTATVLAAAGEDLSSGGALDGRDLMPVLTGEAPVEPRDLFWRTNYGGANQRAVRSGDWKLIVDGGGLHTMLFDVAADPGERREIIRDHPDVARELLAKLDAWTKEVDPDEPEAE